jgi:hypothetical protein
MVDVEPVGGDIVEHAAAEQHQLVEFLTSRHLSIEPQSKLGTAPPPPHQADGEESEATDQQEDDNGVHPWRASWTIHDREDDRRERRHERHANEIGDHVERDVVHRFAERVSGAPEEVTCQRTSLAAAA